MNSDNKKNIAVVGAGIAGLACAYELQKAGFNVEVFEANDYVGGRMASRAKDGLMFDIGANFLVNNYEQAKAYCQELGIMDQFKPMKKGDHYVVRDGELHIISTEPKRMLREMTVLSLSSRLRLIKFFLRDGKKAIGLNFYNLNESTEYDTDNAYDHVKKIAGKEVADYITDAFTATYQFHRSDEISLAGMLALLGLMAGYTEDFEMHHTLGEMSALPEAFASHLKVNLSTPVTNIKAKDDGTVQLTANDQHKIFNAVVLASTASVNKKIYANATEAQKTFFDSVKYAATINTCFRVPENALGNISVVMVPYVEGAKISEYTHEKMKGTVKDGKTLVNIGLHEKYAESLMDKSENEIFDIIKKNFLEVCPPIREYEAEIENYDMQKWPEAMPKFAHGYLTTVKNFLDEHQGEQNVFLAGDYLNSPWTEGAMRCGKRVAAEISKKI